MSVHDKLKEKLAGARANYGWKPKDGDNKIFILPPGSRFVGNPETVDTLAFQYKAHWFQIEGQQGEASRCLADLGKVCPACQTSRAHSGSSDPGLKELAKKIRQGDNYLFNIIDLADVDKGVQRWSANWTCWTSIMEVACNPAWGYVFEPSNGIGFVVTFTKKDPRKGGNNSYKVTPEPQRISVMDIIAAKGGVVSLDGLEEAAMEAKTAEEIQVLVDGMGLPPITPRAGAHAPAPVAAPRSINPISAAPAPAAVPATPAAVPSPQPAVIAPQPVAVPAAVPATPAAVPTPLAPRPIGFHQQATVVAPHYDPGPSYVPKMPDGVRPTELEVGTPPVPKSVPRCFSDYQPSVHRCGAPCPVITPCQMKMMGISGKK